MKYVLPKNVENDIINKRLSDDDLLMLNKIYLKDSNKLVTIYILLLFSSMAFALFEQFIIFLILFILSFYIIYLISASRGKFLKLVKKYYPEIYEYLLNGEYVLKKIPDGELGCLVSKNISLHNKKVLSIYRTKSMSSSRLTGWVLNSVEDNSNYKKKIYNYDVISIDDVNKIIPDFSKIINTPFGTKMNVLYENDKFIGFIDSNTKERLTINQILERNVKQ